MAAVDIVTGDGQQECFVARVHGEWELGINPDLAEQEYRLLAMLHEQGIPVPRPLGLDRGSCHETVLLMEFLDGNAMSSPRHRPADRVSAARAAAEVLARIHGIDPGEFGFLPDGMASAAGRVARGNDVPNDEFMERVLGEALTRRWPPAAVPGRLLHGDYWPGNMMFRGEEFLAVLDWEEAALGDPLMDVAIARLEIFWLWGAQACEAFTAGYCPPNKLDEARLAVWDLFAAFRMARGIPWWQFDDADWQLAREGHAAFTALALERLGES